MLHAFVIARGEEGFFGFGVVDHVERVIEPLVARLLFGKGLQGLLDQLARFLQTGRIVLGTEVAFESRVDRRVLDLLKVRALGVFGDELVVVHRGGFVVVMLHVVFGDLERGIVGQLAGRIVVPDVLEGLEGVALRCR